MQFLLNYFGKEDVAQFKTAEELRKYILKVMLTDSYHKYSYYNDELNIGELIGFDKEENPTIDIKYKLFKGE